MSAFRLHLDEDADSHAFLRALRHRGLDVTSTGEEGLSRISDIKQLEWTTQRQRAIFTYNVADFCKLHSQRMHLGQSHAGIVIGDQQTLSVGEQTRRLLKLAEAKTAEQMQNQLEFLNNWR